MYRLNRSQRDAPAYELYPHNITHDGCVTVTNRCIPYHLERAGVHPLPTETDRIHKSQTPALLGCLETAGHLKDLRIGRRSGGGNYLEAHTAGLATACTEVPDLVRVEGLKNKFFSRAIISFLLYTILLPVPVQTLLEGSVLSITITDQYLQDQSLVLKLL